MLSRKEYVKLACEEYERNINRNTKSSEINYGEYEKLMMMKESAQNRLSTRSGQIMRMKKSLLSEAIYNLYDKCLGFQLEAEQNDAMKRAIVNNFIEEQGVTNLLGSFKRNSYLLSEYARIIEETSSLVIEKCEKEDCEIDIDSELKSDFYDQLDTEDAEEIANLVKMRVAEAEDEFIQRNMTDRIEIKEILQKSQEKINSTKSEAVKESCDLAAKAAITKIRERNNKNVLESMVYTVSKSAFTNDEMNKMYVNENSLNLDSITERCKIMYTFLELANTAKLVKVNESYVNNILKGLQA